jgi:phosphoglucomutase
LKLVAISDTHHFVLCRYTDPVDGSQTSNQGIILNFEVDGDKSARVVFRLSGTGSSGATIRVYFEQYDCDENKHNEAAPVALQSLADHVIAISMMKELTGRESPTVIT